MRCVPTSGNSSGRIRLFVRHFRKNQNGAIAPLFALMLPPILLAMMLAIDAANLMRVRGNVQHSLDATALAVGKRYSVTASQDEMRAYGTKIFNANLRAIDASNVKFQLEFPKDKTSKQEVRATADFPYTSFFGKAVKALTNGSVDWDKYTYSMYASVRLKNTIEVALVMDNSGSMAFKGYDSRAQRITLLQDASKKLVDTLAEQANKIAYLEKPIQFSVVPFASAVNIGPENRYQKWMDLTGASPVHYENFTMPTQGSPINIGSNKDITFDGRDYKKSGRGWGSQNGDIFTRFSLYDDIKNTANRTYSEWRGCVEVRPGIYGLNAAPATLANPASMYVPMFAPDEHDAKNDGWWSSRPAGLIHWWPDNSSLTNDVSRQKDLKKYYTPYSRNTEGSSKGPNYNCTTTPITPLTEVTDENGLATVKGAIDKMRPLGGTNVPEGMVWGWRTLTDTAPFPHGRASDVYGNDKVIIVLTDGANTYYRYNGNTLRGTDATNNISDYSSFGYTAVKTKGYDETRIFQEAKGVEVNHTEDQYTSAMNARFSRLCELAKADKIMVMTVALDLIDPNKPKDNNPYKAETAEDIQIRIMKECASESRVRFDENFPTQRAKLFWNTSGGNLDQTFKEIADELSNLRVVE